MADEHCVADRAQTCCTLALPDLWFTHRHAWSQIWSTGYLANEKQAQHVLWVSTQQSVSTHVAPWEAGQLPMRSRIGHVTAEPEPAQFDLRQLDGRAKADLNCPGT